ncbi:MAG: zf-HC2 domain-containing protein [bacterium]
MRQCKMNDELWRNDFNGDDRLVAEHIAVCDICRADAVVNLRLRRLISSLPIVATPASVLAKFNELKQITANRSMDCSQVSGKLLAWYAGDLDIIDSFLLEDHLLWCSTCRKEVATLDAVGTLLHRIENITPPVTIHADMLAMAGVVGAGLTCDAVMPLLSLWGDGQLTRVESFLIEEHLLSCENCREQAEKIYAVSGLMHNLPVLEAPTAMRESVAAFAAVIGDKQLTCEAAVPMIELYRDGMLNNEETFLLEDHLLWCEPCANILEQSAMVTELLTEMPQLDPPAEIAARIRLTKPPVWTRQFITRVASIAAVAAIALTVSMFSHKTTETNIAQLPTAQTTRMNPVEPSVKNSMPTPGIKPANDNHVAVSILNTNAAPAKKLQNNTGEKIYTKFRGIIKESSALIASLAADNTATGTTTASMPTLRNLQGLPARQQTEEQKDRTISADYMVNEIVASANVKLAPDQSVRPVRALVTGDRITIRDDMTAIAREDELSEAEDLNAAPDTFMIAMADTTGNTR